jgi:hypothetical protein
MHASLPNPAVNWTASTLRVPAASYFTRWATRLTTMKITSFSIFLFACPIAFAADTLEPWGYPDPNEFVMASNVLCADQAKSALLAWHYARKGRTRDEVLALIPESPKAFPMRLTSAMRENVEDAFSYPEISQYALYSFRAEICMRETLGAVRMPRLSLIEGEIRQCQRTHGTDKSNELFKCIQSAVRKVEPK